MIRIDTDDEIDILGKNAQTAKKQQEQKERRRQQESKPKEKKNRDPNNINDYIAVSFENVLGEPSSGPRSFDFMWECSGIMYSCINKCMYKLASLFCGVCIAIPWACNLAVATFFNIWICGPCIHVYNIFVGVCCRSICVLLIATCFAPVIRVFAYIFSRIRYTTQTRPVTADKTAEKEGQRKKRIRERQKLKEKLSEKEPDEKKEIKNKEAPAATIKKSGATVVPKPVFVEGSEKVARTIGRSINMFN